METAYHAFCHEVQVDAIEVSAGNPTKDTNLMCGPHL